MTKQEFFNLISIKSGYSIRTIETIYNSIIHTSMIEYKINNQFTLPNFLTMLSDGSCCISENFKQSINNTTENMTSVSISQFSNLYESRKENIKINKSENNSIDNLIDSSIKYKNTLDKNVVKDCWYCIQNKKYYKTIKQIENDLNCKTSTFRRNFGKGKYKWKNYDFVYVPFEKLNNDFEIYNIILKKDKPITENYLENYITKEN